MCTLARGGTRNPDGYDIADKLALDRNEFSNTLAQFYLRRFDEA